MYQNSKSQIQGVALSPILIGLTSSDWPCHANNDKLFKYVGDTSLVNQWINNGIMYWEEVEQFCNRWRCNDFEHNIGKRYEMLVDSASPTTSLYKWWNGRLS